MDASARRSSKLLFAFALYPCFIFLLLLSFAGASSVTASSIQRTSDRLLPRQESNSSTSLEPNASSTDLPPVPSPSDIISSSSQVVETLSETSLPSSPSSPPSSPIPISTPSSTPTSIIITSSSEPASFTSSAFASSQSEAVSRFPSIVEPSSSVSTTSLSSTTRALSSASILFTQPATTLVIDDTLQPPPTSDIGPGVETFPINPSETGTSDPATNGATSTGFWGNRPAVIATFTVVSFVGIALLVLATTTFLRRRARQRKQEEDLYRDPSFIDDNADRFSSPGASIRQKPLEPLTSNDVVYTNYDFHDPFAYPATDSHNASTRQLYDATVRPYQEQAGYVPTTASQAQGQPSDSTYHSGRTASAYWASDAPKAAVKSTPKQYMLPSQAQAVANAPNNYYSAAPAQSREEPVRASVDSFYGYKGNQQQRP